MRIIIIGIAEDIEEVSSFINHEENTVDILFWNDYEQIYDLIFRKTNYDVCVIAVRDEELADAIVEQAARNFGIEHRKIINYYLFYHATIPHMKMERVLSIPRKNYDGIILGISYSEVGIIPEILGNHFINLSVSSQDLFYNLKTLEYVKENYPERMKGIQYLILDMFDYTYFNFDISLSKTVFYYYSYGGYVLDEHNFGKNKSVHCSFDEGMKTSTSKKYKDITEDQITLWYSLFGDVHKKDGYKGYKEIDEIYKRNRIVDDDAVKRYEYEQSIVKNVFENTISENIAVFDRIIELARSINPDIRIVCVILPQYIKGMDCNQDLYFAWKERFIKSWTGQ